MGDKADGKEAELEASRKRFFEDSRFDPTHPRYGLFSFTGTLAIGDDSIGRWTKPKRGSDGCVMVGPKNFYTKPVKSGRTKDVYFSMPTFHTVGDPYVDPHKILGRTKPAPPKEDVPPFKPGGPVSPKVTYAPYQSLEPPEKKSHRDESGAVIIAPKNFVASYPKKGSPGSTPGLVFGSYPASTDDPYDRKRVLEHEERLRQKALIKHDRPFRSNSPGDRDFASAMETFSKVTQNPPQTMRVTKSAVFEHDRPFKPPNPAKTGVVNMTIGRYPEHKACPEAKAQSPPHFEHPWR